MNHVNQGTIPAYRRAAQATQAPARIPRRWRNATTAPAATTAPKNAAAGSSRLAPCNIQIHTHFGGTKARNLPQCWAAACLVRACPQQSSQTAPGAPMHPDSPGTRSMHISVVTTNAGPQLSSSTRVELDASQRLCRWRRLATVSTQDTRRARYALALASSQAVGDTAGSELAAIAGLPFPARLVFAHGNPSAARVSNRKGATARSCANDSGQGGGKLCVVMAF